jgi:hypothetical protein
VLSSPLVRLASIRSKILLLPPAPQPVTHSVKASSSTRTATLGIEVVLRLFLYRITVR